MIQRPDGLIIRFGLGGKGHPQGRLWRLWVRGDETYLGVRTMLGIAKVSLHSNGYWVLSVGNSRVSISGPRALCRSWRCGPRVVFPGIPPETPLAEPTESTHRRVSLFAPPPTYHWRDFAVLFADDDASSGPPSSDLPTGSNTIGPLPLRNGGAVWLATFVTPMTDDDVAFIRGERAKLQLHVTGGTDAVHSALALLVQDADIGETMLVNIELGLECFVVNEKAERPGPDSDP